VLTLFLLLAGLAAAYFITPAQFLDHVIGAGAGFSAFAILAWAYRFIRGREGLGFGDAKLLGGLGAWVAWQGLATVVLFAAVLALAGVLVRGLQGARLNLNDRVPFGAYISAAGWLVWLYGPLALG
jgi:leader peptidase (prepilin peptidase)/N-methyltransferase